MKDVTKFLAIYDLPSKFILVFILITLDEFSC